MTPERIATLKEMHLTTDLGAEAEIVAPPGAAWQPLAERVQAVIRTQTGRSLPIVSGESASLSALGVRHWVALGSAMNNPALMALYRRKCAFIDDFYPGGDGYVLQSIHNPEGRGHNVLLVGASGTEGAAAGLARLEEVLAGSGARLGYTHVARSDTHAALLPSGLTPERFQQQMEEAFAGNALRGPIEQGINLGLAHHFTHDTACAAMFRDVLFYYEDLVRERFGGEWCFEHMLFIYAWTWRLFYVWDLIEESDAFTDAERLRMTNLLWGLTHYVAGLRYFQGEELPRPEIRQNHSTFAGLSMAFSAGYFRTYYGIDAFAKELRVCQAIFDGQADCYKPNDDGGGGGYCWLVPNHLLTYDLRRDDFRFPANGHLRGIADYAILITDNLGSQVGFGDVGAYGARRKPSPGVTSTLCKAAWYYQDGGYLGALEWMGGTGPQHDCFYQDLPRRLPEHLAGIAVAPFNPPLYDWAERHGPGGANVPLAEAFDKLTLRGGFTEEDEYLLLDGTSTFAHGHEDGNSIERLTWKGRMWLAETDYIWKRPRHHSSVVAICDGESHAMPALVALKWAEQFGGAAFTRTTVPNYNGVDWTRDLFWIQGRLLLAVDSLTLRRDAEYDLRCLWRTLGEAQLEGDALTVEQTGVFFRIQNTDDAEKALGTEEPRVAGQDPYEGYEHASGPIRIFRQRKTLAGRAGQVERYFNLMVAGTAAEVAAEQMTRVAEGVARVDGPGGAILFGVADGPVSRDGLQVTAGAFALTGDTLFLMDGRRVQLGDVEIASDGPVYLALSPAGGSGEIRLKEAARLTVRRLPGLSVDGKAVEDTAGMALAAGTHRLSFTPLPADVLQPALGTGTPYQHTRVPRANRFTPAVGEPRRPVWETAVTGAVRTLEARDGRVAVGTATGEVALLDAGGQVRWRHTTGAEVRALHLTGGNGEVALLAGGRDCALTAFDGTGAVRWKREFLPSHRRDQIVNAVTTADLTGDGRREIVVATDGWLVWALTPEGTEIWQRQIEHHAAQSLVVADVEGDGRREILVGTEYHNSNMLEADGRIRWTTRGGPGFTALALADLNGDGIREAYYGTMDGTVSALDAVSGKLLWAANLGDDVRHGFVLAADGQTGLVAGSECGSVALLDAGGQPRWRRELDAPVTGLALLPDAGGCRIAAATEAGWLVLLSMAGEVIGSQQMGASITALRALELPDGPGLLVGTDDGRVMGWR